MYRKLAIAALSMVFTVLAPQLASAETVLEKVARTGTLTAGTSKDALPFAYANSQGQLTGYSVDMLTLIKQQLETELGRPIQLKLVALSPAQRLPQIVTGNIDIVCDASSFTWARDRQVDFSVSYGITGTRLLVKQGSGLWEPQTLAGKRIGALPQTTNELAIQQAQPQAEIVLVKDRAAAYTALRSGQIDAFASDGILLDGWLQTIENPEDFEIISYPYSKEGIACMVPENNSNFLDTVNYALTRFMQGFLRQEPKYVALFDRWFGPEGILPLTQDLRDLVIENMELIIDFREEIPQKKTINIFIYLEEDILISILTSENHKNSLQNNPYIQA